MKPLKCALCVQVGYFLGFVVHKKGIEINQNKTKAIMETRTPSTKKELQSLLGKVNFLRRFISNLDGKIRAFSPLLHLKKEEFQWIFSSLPFDAGIMNAKGFFLVSVLRFEMEVSIVEFEKLVAREGILSA